MRPVQLSEEAIHRTGLAPFSHPARGGADGSRLTERGLPTPNCSPAPHNPRGPLEWVSLPDMGRARETCCHLAQLWAERGHGDRGRRG